MSLSTLSPACGIATPLATLPRDQSGGNTYVWGGGGAFLLEGGMPASRRPGHICVFFGLTGRCNARAADIVSELRMRRASLGRTTRSKIIPARRCEMSQRDVSPPTPVRIGQSTFMSIITKALTSAAYESAGVALCL